MRQETLTFSASRRFVSDARLVGVYDAQRADERSAWTRVVGSYEVEGDRLRIAADSLISWDSFYGASSAPTVEARVRGASAYDGARLVVEGGMLSLDYTTYPASAPVPATRSFRRVP